MTEKNFIYWEDVDWCYRFRLAGYKLVCLSNSKVYHKYSIANDKTTFSSYYVWRNRIVFFAQYIRAEQISDFCYFILRELFQGVYSCNYYKKYNALNTIMFAYYDAVNGKLGRAGENRIFPKDKSMNAFEEVFRRGMRVGIYVDAKLPSTQNASILTKLLNKFSEIGIFEYGIITDDPLVANTFKSNTDKFDIECQTCDHIFENETFKKNIVYVDRFLNLAATEKDKHYCRQFRAQFELFYKSNANTMETLIYELRAGLNTTL